MKNASFTLGGFILCALPLAACLEPLSDENESAEHLESDRGGIGIAELSLVTGPITVDSRKSLAVTEQAIVSQFTITEVMNQLASQSGIAGLTGAQMWQQLWDTQRSKTTPGATNGPHCDDTLTNGQPSLNGFPYACRTGEGAQASDPVASMAQYFAVGLFNRFDLAPADGSDCGEYRVVFARTPNGVRRNFVIFEAVLPNPSPALGLEGCRPIANLWRDLSSEPSLSVRATTLKKFYFNGVAGSLPVIHIDNYGNGTSRKTGQVRTNQFLQDPWLLREFSLRKVCASGVCNLHFFPATDKTNPFGALFGSTSTDPRRQSFQTEFLDQVPSLALNDVNQFNYTVGDTFNAGQSASQGAENTYTFHFSATSSFATSIQSRLTQIGSPLTPTHIVRRAQALSCAGCHQLNNTSPSNDLGGGITWPGSLVFVHSSESLENGPEGPRFALSNALNNVFLPRRKAVFESYLNTAPPPPLPCEQITLSAPGCFLMETSSGNNCWIRPSWILSFTKQQCFDMNSCGPGGGQSGGDCYKWDTKSL